MTVVSLRRRLPGAPLCTIPSKSTVMHPPLFFIKPLLFFLLSLSLYAVGSPASKSFLWEVTAETGKLYMLGSVHMARQNLFPLKRSIEEAYRASDILAVEVDLEKSRESLPLLVMQHAFFPPGETLKQHITPENHTLLLQHLPTNQFSLERIETMKPWYLSLILTNLSMEKIGADSSYGIDRYLMGKAAEDHKEIIELEGAALQISMLDALPMKEQELLMSSSILEDETMEASFERMMQIWSDGDAEAMERFIHDSLAPYPELLEFNEKFLYARNRKMADTIETLLKSRKNVLVIVGVAHFLGERGIVSLLRKKGYTIRQK